MGKREFSNLRFFFFKKKKYIYIYIYIYDVARWTLGGLGEAGKFTSKYYIYQEMSLRFCWHGKSTGGALVYATVHSRLYWNLETVVVLILAGVSPKFIYCFFYFIIILLL
jgi:hypothetical protein